MSIRDKFKLEGIGLLLVLEQLLVESDALAYYQDAVAKKIPFVTYLVKNNKLTALQIAITAAQGFGLPLMDIECIDLNSIPISLISEQLVQKHGMLPLLSRGTHLYLATDDPSKQDSFKEIQFHTGLNILPIVVETDKLTVCMEHIRNIKENQSLSEYGDDLNKLQDEVAHSVQNNGKTEDAPVVKFVTKILLKAIGQGASDIHFEPYEKIYRIRYRQDGILYEVARPPLNLSPRITARIKIMSHLDISERRLPQDGGFKMTISKDHSLDFRVSTCPTEGGEKVVVRILDPRKAMLPVEALGFSPAQKKQFIHSIKRPQGMILVTGPTGSGKTVTLYSALNMLNTSDLNISTAENPVEIKVSGINQVNINPKMGLTFSSTLRAFLRQDPDIIMVGEIRDAETAEIAVNAAQTGHLVLSTLHTNSAAETLNRLLNIGIPSFNMVSSVTLIIAQRLARTLCNSCKALRNDLKEADLLALGFKKDQIKDIKLYKAVGCTQCSNGYRGRVGLFEMLPMSKSLGELIVSGGSSMDILKKAQEEGMITIYQSGLEKIIEGITSLEEINRVTVESIYE